MTSARPSGHRRPALTELIDPASSALLVIDVQRDFCDPAYARRDVSQTQAMLPTLRRLIDSARAAGVLIVTIRTEHATWSDSPVWLSGPRFGTDLPSGVLCRPGTPGAEQMPGFEPLPGSPVVTKRRYSGFVGTDLDLTLRSNSVRTVIASGVQTNSCVEATARDAFSHEFFVVFAADATATYDESLHRATLITIANHYGLVSSTDEMIALWADRRPSA